MKTKFPAADQGILRVKPGTERDELMKYHGYVTMLAVQADGPIYESGEVYGQAACDPGTSRAAENTWPAPDPATEDHSKVPASPFPWPLIPPVRFPQLLVASFPLSAPLEPIATRFPQIWRNGRQ